MEKATSFSLASMTGATAAIAEPPQMAVPAPMRVVVLNSRWRSLPTTMATRKAVAKVHTITDTDFAPVSSTWYKFISKPSKIIEYWSTFLPV